MPRLSEKFVFRKPRRTLRHLSVADQSRKRHLRRIYKAVRRHSRKNDFFGKRTPGSPAAKNTTSRGRMSPYTALFRIAGRTMTTMEAGIIGGDDFLRLCEKSSNQRFSGGGEQSELIAALARISSNAYSVRRKKRAVLRRLFRGAECSPAERRRGGSLSLSLVCSAPRLLQSCL